MATYNELRGLFSNVELRNRVQVACIVAAEAIRTEAENTVNHANRVIWARKAFNNANDVTDKMLMAVLAANKAATVAAITGATDAAIQSAVDAAVNVFADGT